MSNVLTTYDAIIAVAGGAGGLYTAGQEISMLSASEQAITGIVSAVAPIGGAIAKKLDAVSKPTLGIAINYCRRGSGGISWKIIFHILIIKYEKLKISITKNIKIIFAVTALMTASCSYEKETEKLRDHHLTNILVNLDNSSGSLINLTEISNIDPTSTICVLEPYRSEVDKAQISSNLINKKLKEINYIADEDHWAVVQFSNPNVFKISTVKQTQRRLNDALPLRPIGFCASANLVTLDTGIKNQVTFKFKGEK